DLYRALLKTRRERIIPLFQGGAAACATRKDGAALSVHWKTVRGPVLSLEANLSSQPTPKPLTLDERETVFALGASHGEPLPPWSVLWSIAPA
ncbi:MAG: DUF3459 domain-containing protein, partial [Actinobacteria bacterium]|nr:DUF3459 domain-containing protein [Actinomycetota bacterium]